MHDTRVHNIKHASTYTRVHNIKHASTYTTREYTILSMPVHTREYTILRPISNIEAIFHEWICADMLLR